MKKIKRKRKRKRKKARNNNTPTSVQIPHRPRVAAMTVIAPQVIELS